MKPERLRMWMQKYGNWGVLLVGCYFGLHHLWTQRRPTLAAALLIAGLGVGWLSVQSKTPANPVFSSAPSFSVKTIQRPSPSTRKPRVSRIEMASAVQVQEGSDTWRVEIWEPAEYGESCAYVKFFRNNHLIRQKSASAFGGVGLELGKAQFPTRFPIIVLQAEPLAGHPGPVTIYTIRYGKLLQMGHIGGENGGPIFHDYDRDGKAEWVFDDYNWYDYYMQGPKRYLVYKEGKDGKLRLWKRLPNIHRHRLPGRLGLGSWDL